MVLADSQFDFLHACHGAVEIFGRAQLLDGSMLYITEVTEIVQGQLEKIDYSYQFRHGGGIASPILTFQTAL